MSCPFTRLLYALSYEIIEFLTSQSLLIHVITLWQCTHLFSRMKHRKTNISTKISDEHLENSLRIATTSIEQDKCISITKTRSNILLVLSFSRSVFLCFIKKYIKNKFCDLYMLTMLCSSYVTQDNSCSLSVAEASQEIGHPFLTVLPALQLNRSSR